MPMTDITNQWLHSLILNPAIDSESFPIQGYMHCLLIELN